MTKETIYRASRKVTQMLKKYKYPAIILLLGLALILLPNGKSEDKTAETAEKQADYAEQTEKRLEAMLSRLSGAGQVSVMLTLERGELTQYQTDTQKSNDSDSGRVQVEQKTVILSAGSAYDEAAVSTVFYPRFQGALVVCEGAQSAVVRLNIVQAVAAVTGLGADQITVVKMN